MNSNHKHENWLPYLFLLFFFSIKRKITLIIKNTLHLSLWFWNFFLFISKFINVYVIIHTSSLKKISLLTFVIKSEKKNIEWNFFFHCSIQPSHSPPPFLSGLWCNFSTKRYHSYAESRGTKVDMKYNLYITWVCR